MEQSAWVKHRDCRSPSRQVEIGTSAVIIKAAIERSSLWVAVGLLAAPGKSLAQAGDRIPSGWLAMILGGVAVAGVIGALWRMHTLDQRRRRELEQEIVRLRQSSAAKTTVLSHVSHEIRTPMNAIFGFGGLLRDRVRDPVNRRYVDAIVVNARALLGVTNDLLDISLIETGRIEITEAPTDIRGVVDGVVTTFLSQADAKRVLLKGEVSGDVPPVVSVDGDRLRQILINLVGNALRHTDQGSVLMRADASPMAPGGRMMLRFTVEDSGSGIAANELDRIFEPFARGANPSGESGRGLGLSISRQLSHAMGGELTVSSVPEKGAQFLLIIPGSAVPVEGPRGSAAHAEGDASPAEPDAEAVNPQLVEQLEALLAGQWPGLHNALTLDDVRAFASLVESIGRRGHSEAVVRYARDLAAAAVHVDFARIEELVAEFPVQVSALRARMEASR